MTFQIRIVTLEESLANTTEESPANTTEESPANTEEEISANNDASSVMCTPRRSQQEKRKPDRYGFSCNLYTIEEPVSVKDALMQKEWIDAMNLEMDSLHDNDVWDLVELPKGQKVVGSKWVFKLKTNEYGSVEKCKARLVAQGYSQEKGLNYDETFSPVVKSESIRSAIALASKNGLKMYQLDVTTAFLNGELEEEVYVCKAT